MKLKHLLRLFAICTVIAACGSTPPTHFYVLESTAPDTPADNALPTKGPVIGIGPLTIPALLDRKQIVTRGSNHAVEIAELDQWAAPLKVTIAEVIRQDLSKLNAGMTFRAYPWSAFGGVQYRLVIDVNRFDTEGATAEIAADWAIIDETGHTVVKKGHYERQTPSPEKSYSANVQALNQLLGEFSTYLSKVLNEAW